MTTLSDLLNAARGDRSVDALIDQAQRAGHTIDRGTVFRALKGEHAKSPRDETLVGLAAVFGLDVRELRAAIKRPVGELEPYDPPAFADRLSRDQRRALNELIRTIVGVEVSADQPDLAGHMPGDADYGKFPRDKPWPVEVTPGPFDEDLDALPDERDDPAPVRGRSLPAAARIEDD